MLRAVRYGVLLLLLAAAFGVLAWRVNAAFAEPAWAAPLAWVSFGYGLMALGYLGLGARVLGKSRAGRRAGWAWVLLAPVLASMWLVRRALRLVLDEPDWDEVVPGVYVGRIVATEKLPEDTALVVDLTAEFVEPARTRARFPYLCLPTLDGTAPAAADLAALVDEVAAHPGPIYVHCAAGHGRSAMVAAAVLVARGLAADLDDAEARMKRVRPRIRLTGDQHRRATEALRLRSAAASE